MKRLRTVLLMTLATVGTLELLCRVFDPLGVVYFDDVAYLWNTRIDDPTGYAHVPGRFAIGGRFAITIDADGNRYTPGRFRGGARVTFVGDSQTFGYGVDDGDVWVSRVASALRIDALNTGRSGYNVENIAPLIDEVDGCIVWLTISNDPGTPVRYSDRATGSIRSYLGHTLQVIYGARAGYTTAPITDTVRPLYEAIAARPDTLILALDDGNYGTIVRDEYGAVLIPYFTSRISRTDAHADSEGNRQIAEYILPILDEWLDERNCT